MIKWQSDLDRHRRGGKAATAYFLGVVVTKAGKDTFSH